MTHFLDPITLFLYLTCTLEKSYEELKSIVEIKSKKIYVKATSYGSIGYILKKLVSSTYPYTTKLLNISSCGTRLAFHLAKDPSMT